MSNSLHSSTIQCICNQSSHYEKYSQLLQRKPLHGTTKSNFLLSKDKWNKKEDTGKSVKNALYMLRYAKMHLLGWSDFEQWKKIKPVLLHSLSHCQVMFIWKHQAVSQNIPLKTQ